MYEQTRQHVFEGKYPLPLYVALDNFNPLILKSMTHALNITIAKRSQHTIIDIFTKQGPNDQGVLLPRLFLEIHDKELKTLLVDKETHKINMDDFNALDPRKLTCTCKGRCLYEKVFDPGTDDHDSLAYANCKRCMFAAAKRQMKAAPTPDPNMAKDFVRFAYDRIMLDIGDYLSGDLFGYSFAQWFNHLTKPKQLRMAAIHKWLFMATPDYTPLIPEEIDLDPLKITKGLKQECYEGWNSIDTRLLIYDAICKIEIQPTDGKPRMVCSIPDLIKYTMGPVTWALEQVCADHLRGYCGGENLDQMTDAINEEIDQGFTQVIQGDGSGFDNTQDVQLKELDRMIYRHLDQYIYHVPIEIWQHVSQQLYKTQTVQYDLDGKPKRMLTYSVLGTVFSGDCDTTLMNTIRMAMYNIYTAERVQHYTYGLDYVAKSKGDDFVCKYTPTIPFEDIKQAYDSTFLPKPSKDTLLDNRQHGLGQIIKFLETGQPNDIRFCSLRAWYIDNQQHIFLTRDPDKFLKLGKYARKIKTLNNHHAAQYCLDQATSLEVYYGELYYFRKYAELWRRKARDYETTIAEDYTKISKTKKKKIVKNTPYYQHLVDIESARHHISDTENIMYNKYERRHYYEIVGTYWETMKRIYGKTGYYKLSVEHRQTINYQLAAEFDEYELQALLSPNNEF